MRGALLPRYLIPRDQDPLSESGPKTGGRTLSLLQCPETVPNNFTGRFIPPVPHLRPDVILKRPRQRDVQTGLS